MKGPVLLVDPSATVVTKVRRIYASAGYARPLIAARTVRSALKILSKEPSPSLVIVDLALVDRPLMRALGVDVPLVIWAARSLEPLPGPACLYKPTGTEECRLLLRMIRDHWFAPPPSVIPDNRRALAFLCSARNRSSSSTWRTRSTPRRIS